MSAVVAFDGAPSAAAPLDLAADARVDAAPDAPLIRIAFSSFQDGRGFSLAARLRDLGYTGRLRAHGALIPDQRGHARACGFDEVEMDATLLARQGGAEIWLAPPLAPLTARRRSGA